MRFIVRVTLFFFSIFILIIVGSAHFLRQDPSTAFWIFGRLTNGTEETFQLTSPTGGVRHIAFTAQSTNRVDIMGWLPNQRLLYAWRNEADVYEIREFNLASPQDINILTEHNSLRDEFDSSVVHFGSEEWVLLALSNRQGVAFFRFNLLSDTLERITPYYSNVQPFSTYISPDREWFYYEASLGSGTPHVYYRQRFDGTDRTELIHFTDFARLIDWGAVSTFENQLLLITMDFRESITEIYEITDVDAVPQLLLTLPEYYFPISIEAGWLIFADTGFVSQSYYRVGLDGDDFANVYLSLSERDNPIFSDDGLFYTQYDPLSSSFSLHAVDIDTLADDELFVTDRFNEIRQVQPSWDRTFFLIEGVINGETVVYRVNIDGSDFHQLAAFGERELEALNTLYLQDWILVAVDYGTPQRPQITYFRLYTSTGKMDELFVVTTRTTRINAQIVRGTNTLIVNEARISRNEIVSQYAVNLSNGKVWQANFGADLSFSQIVDSDWNLLILVMIGFGLLMLSVIDGIGRFRH